MTRERREDKESGACGFEDKNGKVEGQGGRGNSSATSDVDEVARCRW